MPKVRTVYDEINKLEDKDLREHLQWICFQAVEVQLVQMVLRSPVLLPLVAITVPVVVLMELIDGSLRELRRYLTNLVQVVDDKHVQLRVAP